ncbi:MAG: efflux RND transporter periplasmic adaptor subunit [Patescibacteria group bacterium]
MTNFLKNLWAKARQRPVISIILVIIVIAVGNYFLRGRSGEEPTLARVERGRIIQEVSVTGKTTPMDNIELAFEKTGRISGVRVEVGDQIDARVILMFQDSSELNAQLQQARATIASQRAKLDELVRGARIEDIEIKKAELAKATQDLNNEYAGVYDVIQDAYTKADDAVRKQINDIFINDETSSPRLTFMVVDDQKKINAESGRYLASTDLKNWQNQIFSLSSQAPETELSQILVSAQTHLEYIRSFLNMVNAVVVGAVSLPEATLSSYLTSLGTARTNVNTTLTNVNQQQQAIASQALVVLRIQNELNLKLAGTAPEELNAQRAQVEQAEAAELTLRAQLAKTILTSPIAGTITKVEAKVGEIVAANSPIVTVISKSNLQVEANIPEADIAKIEVGNQANITLDAYGEDVIFRGKVSSIEPAETMVEGVATYKIKIQFDESDPRVKSGMTANVDIIADARDNVLFLPQRSVFTRNGSKLVMLYISAGKSEEREIKTGLRGSDGNIEIISGLNQGDMILRSPE